MTIRNLRYEKIPKPLNRRDFVKMSLLVGGAVALGGAVGCSMGADGSPGGSSGDESGKGGGLFDSSEPIEPSKQYWAWVSKQIDGQIKWGCINERGEYVVEPKLVEGEQVHSMLGDLSSGFFIEDFQSNGLAIVEKDSDTTYGGLSGCVNIDGDIVIPQEFERIYTFAANGLALATKPLGGAQDIGDGNYLYYLYGFIDASGSWRIDPIYTLATSFADNGLAAIQGKASDGSYKHGYIDNNVQYLIPPQFNNAGSFMKQVHPSLNGAWWAKARREDISWSGMIDESGSHALDFDSRVLEGWSGSVFDESGLLVAGTQKGYGYIGLTGGFEIEPVFRAARGFMNGMAIVETENGLGMIDTTGQFVIEPRYIDLGYFDENGLALARDGVELAFIDKNSNIANNKRYGDAKGFNADGLSFVRDYVGGEGDGRWYLINLSGEEHAGSRYSNVHSWKNGFCAVQDSSIGLWGFVNTKGELVIEPQFIETNGFFEAPNV